MTSNNTPRVSIIIITYNNEVYIEQCVKSALDQTYDSKEIIVIDDGSTDDTRQILEPYMDKIRYHYQENRGKVNARNRGFSLSRGEYINHFDGDDYFLDPDKIKNQVELLDANPSWAFVQGDYEVVDIDGKPIYSVKMSYYHKIMTLHDVVNGAWFHWQSSLIRRQWIELAGGGDERFYRAEDVHLFLKMMACGARMGLENTVTFAYRIDLNNQKHSEKIQKTLGIYMQVIQDLFARNYFPMFNDEQKNEILFHRCSWIASTAGRSAHFKELEKLIEELRDYCQTPANCDMIIYHVLASIVYHARRFQFTIMRENDLIDILMNQDTSNTGNREILRWWLEVWWFYYYLDYHWANDDFLEATHQHMQVMLKPWLDRPIREIVKLSQQALIQHINLPTIASVNSVTYFWQDVMDGCQQPKYQCQVITLYLTMMTRCVFAKQFSVAWYAFRKAVGVGIHLRAISPWLRFFRASAQYAWQKVCR